MPTPDRPYIDVDARAGRPELLPGRHGLEEVRHLFDRDSLHAINAALAAKRPLLVRGEPGTGKSQLARAAAFLLGRHFVWKVVDAQTQVTDLFYTFDAIERLARAQVAGALGRDALAKGEGVVKRQSLEELLDELNFVQPGPLWWAFNPGDAQRQAERYAARAGAVRSPTPAATASAESRALRGHVVLIDEIDKTDPSVPNGLLEALGQGTFAVPRGFVSLHGDDRPQPLIVITTNEERELPSAFLRRCMVLHIPVPRSRDALATWLIKRGETHFPGVHRDVLVKAASMVFDHREAATRLGLSPPGQAEYLDLLRVVTTLRTSKDEQETLLETIGGYALIKHPELHREFAPQEHSEAREEAERRR